MTANGKNLYQRLSAIAEEVGAIKATGKTAQGAVTISISDVEEALGERMVKHGVVTGYRWNDAPVMREITTAGKINQRTGEIGPEGKMVLWQADLTIWLANADKPDEKIEDRVCDIGSNPSAAVSFALKRYYRALFHLADEDDTIVSRERKTALSEAPGNGEGAAGSARPAQSTRQAMGAPSSSPPRNAVATLTPGIPSRDAMLMQVSILAKAKYGETWRADVQKLAKFLIAREFNLVADLSVEELEVLVGELEQVAEVQA